MRDYSGFGLSRSGIALFASLFVLSSCGGLSGAINSPALTAPMSRYASSIDSKLSGERFSSSKAKSSCSGRPWTFQVSGKARGPLPGTFNARGTVSAALVFEEKFEIRSGSKSFSGSADSQASGTPTAGCSKSGQLSFYFPILQYKERHSKVSGMGHAALSGATFTQGFE